MKKKRIQLKAKVLLMILLIPVMVAVILVTAIVWTGMNRPDLLKKSANTLMDLQDRHGPVQIPAEYIPIYMDAANEYEIPWTLLAAHHRIETRFSTMDPLLSPAGAEGHMQFMPCTFVGWSYPGCAGLGKGEIPEEDKTNPEIIKEHGGYGVDANGDGIADPFNIEDAIYSTANYLSSSGAAEGEIKQAIFEYNRSEKYVNDVLWYFNKYEEEREKIEASFVND